MSSGQHWGSEWWTRFVRVNVSKEIWLRSEAWGVSLVKIWVSVFQGQKIASSEPEKAWRREWLARDLQADLKHLQRLLWMNWRMRSWDQQTKARGSWSPLQERQEMQPLSPWQEATAQGSAQAMLLTVVIPRSVRLVSTVFGDIPPIILRGITCCVSHLAFTVQIPEIIDFWGEEVYFGSPFGKFRCMVGWPHCFWVVARHVSWQGACWRVEWGQRTRERDQGPANFLQRLVPSDWRLGLTSSNSIHLPIVPSWGLSLKYRGPWGTFQILTIATLPSCDSLDLQWLWLTVLISWPETGQEPPPQTLTQDVGVARDTMQSCSHTGCVHVSL